MLHMQRAICDYLENACTSSPKEKVGAAPDDAPPDEEETWVDPDTGEIWDYVAATDQWVKRKDEKKSRSKKDDEEAAEAAGAAPPATANGASAPWPGVNVSLITEDIDFPQDREVILSSEIGLAMEKLPEGFTAKALWNVL